MTEELKDPAEYDDFAAAIHHNERVTTRRYDSVGTVAFETVYETIIHWDEGGGKRSRRELARRIVDLFTAPAQRPAEPVQEPVAKVELMTTGGNAGLATRIVEIDDHLRDRLRPGQLLYTAPPASVSEAPQRPAEPVQEPVAWRTFDGEGGYDYRTYEDNEDYAAEWAKRNPRHVGWVEPLYTAPPQRQPPATIDEMFARMDNAPRGVFSGHDPMTIWMEAWRAAEQHHGIKEGT